MPVVRVEGFVLRVHPLGEADKIVTFLTREEGKVRGVARSARKSRRRFGSSLEPWSRVSLTLFEKEGRELARIDACDLLESAYRLHETLETAYLLAYLAEVADRFGRERQPEPHYYRLLGSILASLRAGLTLDVALRYFETWTLRLHGLLPDLERCGECNKRLSSGGFFQGSTDRLLCEKCLGRPASGDFRLSREGLDSFRCMLRSHPVDLVTKSLPVKALTEIGRVTETALESFAESPFRTRRFLSLAQGLP